MPSDPLIQTLQITAISSAYYLYTNLLPWDSEVDTQPERCLACNSLPVGGLSSQAYGGKIFWDAEMFMAPPAQGTHPRLARQFAQYRINRASEAKKNVQEGASKAQQKAKDTAQDVKEGARKTGEAAQEKAEEAKEGSKNILQQVKEAIFGE